MDSESVWPAMLPQTVAGFMQATRSLAMGLGSVAAGVLVEVTSSRALLNVQASIFVLCGLISFVFVR